MSCQRPTASSTYSDMVEIPKKYAQDFHLPVLGFGTYLMGGRHERSLANNDRRDIAAIRAAIGFGFNHIDTAESYAGGYCETLVRQAVSDTERSKLFITTKVSATNLHYDDLIAAAKRSLERLGVDYIDLYLIHRPSNEIPIAESMLAMDFLYENGLIKNIGVSNFNAEQLAAAMAATKYRIVNNQIHFGLSARFHEQQGTLDFCQKNNILVTAYRAVGYDQLIAGSTLLAPLAEKYHKTPTQVALNWLINQPNIVGLVKSTNPIHIEENLGALGWQLTVDELNYLAQNFPVGKTINTTFN